MVAGRELIAERGLSSALGSVTLNNAIDRSGVPRPSAYRLFAGNDREPQKAFHAALLLSFFQQGAITDTAGVYEVIGQVLAPHPDLFDTGTSEELGHVLREAIRLGGAAHLVESAGSLMLSVYITALAATMPTGAEQPDFYDAICDSERSANGYNSMYQDVLGLFGLRLKPGFSWEIISVLMSASAMGTSLMVTTNPWAGDIIRPTGPDGEDQVWTTLGVLTEAILLNALEEDPTRAEAALISDWYR